MIKDFRIEKEDRKVGKKQYMYYRIEGDDTVNNGVTSQEERKQYWISFYHSDDPQIGFNKKKVL